MSWGVAGSLDGCEDSSAVTSNCREKGVWEGRIRDPKEEVDRVPSIPRIYSGLVWQESEAYKVGTVCTKALLIAGRPKEGSARLGVFGGWCEGGGS